MSLVIRQIHLCKKVQLVERSLYFLKIVKTQKIYQNMNLLKRNFRIIVLPLFEDNYSYIIQGTAAKKLVLVDPANPKVILSYLKQSFPKYMVTHVLYTHKHWDHAGGSLQLYNILNLQNSNVSLMIGLKDRQYVEGANYSLQMNEQITIGNSIVNTMHVPCHTRGHTIYNFQLKVGQSQIELNEQIKEDQKTIQGRRIRIFYSNNCSFTGDTLFIGGIGRFFEGNAAQMVSNISNIINKIKQDSDIFVGHQYTFANLKWAKEVEKDNTYIKSYFSFMEKQIQETGILNLCTLPSNLLKQKNINLFVRAVTGTPLHQSITKNSIQLMNILREMKNQNQTIFPEQKNTSSL